MTDKKPDGKRLGRRKKPGSDHPRESEPLQRTGEFPSFRERLRRYLPGGADHPDPASPSPEPADPLEALYEAGQYEKLADFVETTVRRGHAESPRQAWRYARVCLDIGQPERLLETATRFRQRSWRHRGFRTQYFQVLISLDRIPEAIEFVKESILLGAFDLEFMLRAIGEYRLLGDRALVVTLVDIIHRRWGGELNQASAVFLQNVILNTESLLPALRYALPWNGHSFRADNYFLLANASILEGNHAAALRYFNEVLTGFNLSPVALREPGAPFAASNLTSAAPAQQPRHGPLVTVAMSTFNASATVVPALTSLLMQSYTDLEILVVDDCSSDRTAELVERHARDSDSRVRLIRMAENGGTYRARNRALAEARGTYFTCNDADDWSHPQKIATLVDALASGEQIAAKSRLIRLNPEIGIKPKRNGYIHDDMSSTLFRRQEVIERIGFFDPVRFGADSEYVARLALAFGKSALSILAKPLLVAHWSNDTLSAGRGTGISDGGIFYPQRAAYRYAFRQRHARGEGIRRGPDGQPVVDAASEQVAIRDGAATGTPTRAGWRLEGSTLIYRDPAIDLFWRMPEGFRMPSNALLTLAETLLFQPFGRDVPVGPDATRPPPDGGRVAVAFSGGIDSAAALRLLPDPIPIYTQVARPGGKHRVDNALLAVEEVGGIAIVTNQDELPPTFGERRGYYGFGGFTITAVLLAEHFNIRTIADGNIIDAMYLEGPGGHGTIFNRRDPSAGMDLFARAGLQYCAPIAGLTEVSTESITTDLRYAMGCMRGAGGKPCHNCMKCYRKEALRGRPIPSCDQAETILAREPIPVLGTLLWAAAKRGLSHPRLDARRHKDISWVDKWYPKSIEFIPTDLRGFFLERLRHYGIEPMTDLRPLETWDAREAATPAG